MEYSKCDKCGRWAETLKMNYFRQKRPAGVVIESRLCGRCSGSKLNEGVPMYERVLDANLKMMGGIGKALLKMTEPEPRHRRRRRDYE